MSSARIRLFIEIGPNDNGSDVCDSASSMFGYSFIYKPYNKYPGWIEVWSDVEINIDTLEVLLSKIASLGWVVSRGIDGISAVWNQVEGCICWDSRLRWANVEVEL